MSSRRDSKYRSPFGQASSKASTFRTQAGTGRSWAEILGDPRRPEYKGLRSWDFALVPACRQWERGNFFIKGRVEIPTGTGLHYEKKELAILCH